MIKELKTYQDAQSAIRDWIYPEQVLSKREQDALLCWIIRSLSQDHIYQELPDIKRPKSRGKNLRIRKALEIPAEKQYLVSQALKISDVLTPAEYKRWFAYSKQISLGHIRQMIRLPINRRFEIFEDLIHPGGHQPTVRALEAEANNIEVGYYNENLKTLVRDIEDATGYRFNIQQIDHQRKTGTLSIGFGSYEHLEEIGKALIAVSRAKID